MDPIPLYNLDLGEKHPGERFGKVPVGPFVVKVVDNYAEQVGKIPHNATRTDGFDTDTGKATTTFREAGGSGWHVTAVATPVQGAGDRSILCEPPADDGGAWDLCTILTFLTGRRVSTAKSLDQFSPLPFGSHACLRSIALEAAAISWSRRNVIAERGLATALFLYNEATSHDLLQVFASLYNTALNVVLDKSELPLQNVASEKRNALREKVMAAVESCDVLSEAERGGFQRRLGSTIDQGLLSLADKLPALLIDLGVIGPRGTEGQDDDAVFRRVRFVNTVRNGLTHTGKIPKLNTLNEDQARRHAIAITSGVVPDIFKLAMGKVLALDPRDTKGFALLTVIRQELTAFFARGIWRDWPLEEKSFDEWFYAMPSRWA